MERRTPEPTKQFCDRAMGGCGRLVLVLGAYRLNRILRGGERTTPPNGVTWCQGCHVKWEIVPARENAA